MLEITPDNTVQSSSLKIDKQISELKKLTKTIKETFQARIFLN